MIKTIEEGKHFHVTGTTPNEIHSSLDAAVELAQMRAIDDGGQGILVTRHRPDFYSIALNASVPFGFIWEQEAGSLSTPS
ncbi:hypothetical protein [Paenarthrobacter nitroguajacolicus]|uniref:hypothetical protein n=1 Tax=Paenarthrobacter nitroguajacolicus TaxID=211146 RepID=UPI000A8E532C|nr:hypothetical protein [Paenarthrobacter nitroguajacolicus]